MDDKDDHIFERFYNYSLKFLSYRIRSEKEIREKLKTKQVEPQIIEKIIAKLKEKKFIDDENFARMWIENRNRFKPRSLRLIKMELKQKGIEEEIFDKMINDEGLMINDLEQAKKLVEKRIGRLKGLPKQEIYEKLGRYLASKGFNWDTIKKAIDLALRG
jgi:regulatory protein